LPGPGRDERDDVSPIDQRRCTGLEAPALDHRSGDARSGPRVAHSTGDRTQGWHGRRWRRGDAPPTGCRVGRIDLGTEGIRCTCPDPSMSRFPRCRGEVLGRRRCHRWFRPHRPSTRPRLRGRSALRKRGTLLHRSSRCLSPCIDRYPRRRGGTPGRRSSHPRWWRCSPQSTCRCLRHLGDFAVARYKICRTSSRRSSIPC
jgi:hypothetical protein